MIEVRTAKQADAAVLADILVESFTTAFASIISAETIAKCANKENCRKMMEDICADTNTHSYLALSDGEPCGEIFWRADEECDNEAEIVALHSLPHTFGTGVGQALMQRALKDIQASGRQRVYLWAFKDNKRAGRFYEKCGFVLGRGIRKSEFDDALEVVYVYEMN